MSRVIILEGVLCLVSGGVLGVLLPSADFASGDLSEAGGALVGAAVASAGLGSFTARLLVGWSAARRRRHSALGHVTGRTTRERPGQHRHLYQRVLRVSFPVGEERHELEWAPSNVFSSSQAPLERIDERHPDGSQVAVRYEPGHPENSGVDGSGALALGAVALAIAFSAATLGVGFIAGSVASGLLAGDGATPLTAPAPDEIDD